PRTSHALCPYPAASKGMSTRRSTPAPAARAARFASSSTSASSWHQCEARLAPAGELGVAVERLDGCAMLVLPPVLAGDHPHDFDLVAVGVLAVQRLRGAVVALTDERAEARQRVPSLGQVVDRRDLPREVVETDAPSLGSGRVRAY